MTENIEQIRADFERVTFSHIDEAARFYMCQVNDDENMTYAMPAVQLKWESWQAAAELYASELEELRKDRERLDWLLDVRAAHLVTGVVQCLGPYDNPREPAQTPREAIDNAMKVGE